MKTLIASVTALAVLVGCTTAPPNTPGAGTGDTYTPFIDLAGVDQDRYASDLAGCRAYAQQIDPNKKALEGMLGGILIGAMIGAAAGGNTRYAEQGALAGGSAGVTAAGAKAVVKQETILANCMAGRGYRVLEGATQPTNTAVPSPYGGSTQAQALAHNQAPHHPAYMPQGQDPQPARAAPVGKDAGNVEKLARQAACSDNPRAKLIASGPGYESYSIDCTGGDNWAYRCEFGNCRRLN